MKFTLLSLLLLGAALHAITLDEIIATSLAKSPSLEVINSRIEANKHAVDVANQYSNPEVLLTKNTLDSSQAMSQTLLTLKQKIPYFNKLDSQQKIALAEDAILEQKLHAAKVNLVATIKQEAYKIWELRELTNIINEYMQLTNQNIKIYESYTSIESNQHMGIMKAELSLSDLLIQKSTLNAQIIGAYARLSYLAAFDITHLDINLEITHKPKLYEVLPSIKNNPQIAIKEKEILKENAKIKVADLNNYPDINLMAGYAYRENFDNYMNIGLGITLPIYATEDYKEEEARSYALSVVSQKEDVTIAVNASVKVYFAQMLSAHDIYHIVQDDALPQVAHMFELSNSSISTGGDLFKYIDVLFEKLSLEKKSINAVALYFQANAQISKIAGEIQ